MRRRLQKTRTQTKLKTTTYSTVKRTAASRTEHLHKGARTLRHSDTRTRMTATNQNESQAQA
eukprot:1424471-Rhodomonas_salina.2